MYYVFSISPPFGSRAALVSEELSGARSEVTLLQDEIAALRKDQAVKCAPPPPCV